MNSNRRSSGPGQGAGSDDEYSHGNFTIPASKDKEFVKPSSPGEPEIWLIFTDTPNIAPSS
jgi:hypothetical protein